METAASCRDLAASWSAQALAEPLANARLSLEASAAAWRDRADMLDRLGLKRATQAVDTGNFAEDGPQPVAPAPRAKVSPALDVWESEGGRRGLI